MVSVNPVEIACPKCGEAISLDETLAGPAIARIRSEAEQALAEARKNASAALEAERLEAKEREDELRSQLEEEQRSALESLRQDAHDKAQAEAERKIKAATDEADEYRKKLAESEEEQLKLQREKRELDDAKRRFELDKVKAVNEAVDAARQEAETRAKEDSAQTVAQLELQLKRAQEHAAEMQRKLEQKPSQELQGEATEVLLEERLSAAFRTDLVEPVKKGQRGADIMQRVNGALGAGDGLILWESKNAQNWSNDWPAKARENGREAGAAAVVIVSAVLPKDLKWICHHDSVYVCEPRYAVALATVLRNGIIEVSSTRLAVEGRATLAEKLWDYATGPAFRARVQAGMEAYSKLVAHHDQDKRRTLLRWRAVEKQQEQILHVLCGIAGDVHGLGGADLSELEAEPVLALAAAEDATSEGLVIND